MKKIKYALSMLALALVVNFALCSFTRHTNKPQDLSFYNPSLETLLQNRPHAILNSDSTILASHIPENDEEGDSMVFKFDKKGNLISRIRYFGNNPEDLNFSEIIYRDNDGRIDSIKTTTIDVPKSYLKNISHLFDNTDTTANCKLSSSYSAKNSNENIEVHYFKYDYRKKHYFLNDKVKDTIHKRIKK
jgi:hypothetical protein